MTRLVPSVAFAMRVEALCRRHPETISALARGYQIEQVEEDRTVVLVPSARVPGRWRTLFELEG